MRRLLKLLAALAAGVALAAAWDRRGGAAGLKKVFSKAARWSLPFRHSTGSATPPRLGTRVAFEWVTLDRDAAGLKAALQAEGVPFVLVEPARGAARRQMITRKLTAVGMYFDEEPNALPSEPLLLRASGAAAVGQLGNAIERFLEGTTEGLVVDSTAHVVEIDEQTDLGFGGIVLIEPNGAHQLRSGSRRVLTEALEDAARRLLPLGFRPRPDLPALRHELAGFPRAIDDLLATIQPGLIPGGLLSYERAERLGALRRCDQCRTPIVDVGTVGELVAEFYSAPERKQDVADALVRSGLEVGDPLSPNFCSQHGQITPTSNQ